MSRQNHSPKPSSARVKREGPQELSCLQRPALCRLAGAGMLLSFRCCSKVLFVLEVVGGGRREVTYFQLFPAATVSREAALRGSTEGAALGVQVSAVGVSFPRVWGATALQKPFDFLLPLSLAKRGLKCALSMRCFFAPRKMLKHLDGIQLR